MSVGGAASGGPRARCYGDRFAVQWHLSDRCSGTCSHCYRERPARAELEHGARLAILDEIAGLLESLGVPGRIHFAGGEPFECEDLLPLMRRAWQRGIPSRVLSNGTRISRALADELPRAGCVGVQISVEGPPPIHDAIRGAGSLRAALAGAEAVRATGVPVTFSMTLQRANAGAIDAVARLAAERADRLYCSRLVPLGRAAGLRGELLGRGEWQAALEGLVALSRAGELEVAMRDPTFRPLFMEAELAALAPAVAGCAAGYHTITIESDGAVMPCRRLGIAIGRLGERSLVEIWRESELLARLRDRDRLRGRCGRCPYRWVCGGCRAVAAAVSGDPLGEDPQCPWRSLSARRVRRGARRALERARQYLRT